MFQPIDLKLWAVSAGFSQIYCMRGKRFLFNLKRTDNERRGMHVP
jgi:hypothetical protein